jgi:predicted nucleic acid-binding protein
VKTFTIAMRFVDTNVLLYAISTAAESAPKTSIARRLLIEPDLAVSTQVLQEFYVQSTRRSRAGALLHDDAVLLMRTWLRFHVQDVTIGVVMAALATHARWQLSYLDAAIIEAARACGCDTVLSEDMQHGQHFDGVQVINPFC